MAIDASIYGQIQAPKENNLLAQYGQMQQIQNAQAQNRLADLMYGEKEREIAGSRAVDDAYRGATGADGVIDRQKLYSSIAQTSGRQLPGIQKGFSETDKNTREAEKAKIEQQLQRFDVIGRIAAGVTDQASYDRSKQEMAQVFGQEAAASMPATYDPQLTAENKARAMDVKTRLEQQWKRMEYSTPNANSVLQATTSTANNAATNTQSGLNNVATNERLRLNNQATQLSAQLNRDQSALQHNATMGKPFAATGADGAPVLVRQDRAGNITQVEDYTPPTAALKQIPATVNSAIIQNRQSTGQIDRALQLLGGTGIGDMKGDKSATGYKGYLPNNLLNRIDPQGVDARAAIADIGSLIIHDRSGAAVTLSEAPRLMPFIPLATDDAKTVEKKLKMLRVKLGEESTAMNDIYSKEQGYRPSPGPSTGPKDGDVSKSKSGQSIVMRNGKWEYQ